MSETILSGIRIVLVEPAGPLNIGAIARVMKNMGLQQLVLVNPQCDPLGTEARQMAVHGADLLEAAQRVASLPEALRGAQRAIATTARDRSLRIESELPRTALPWLLGTSSALIFGPEERGLSNTELNYAQRFMRIPSSPTYPALNLAQAVAICCYELYQLAQNNPPPLESERRALSLSPNSPCLFLEQKNFSPEASLDNLEGYYQQLEAVLLRIGYLYPHTAASQMAKFRRLFNRAQLSSREVAMLRGILSQVEWAIRPDLPPNSPSRADSV
jgi:tRNA/rRNA methyltransferase